MSDAIKTVTAQGIERPERLVTVHSGIDPARFQGMERQGLLHREFGVDPACRLVGNVAALAPHKGNLTFVDTAQMVVAIDPKVHFFAIGEGKSRPEVEAYIGRRGSGRFITLTGFRSDVAQVLKELDVFLMTSDTEGLGTAVLDAFASGVPVVATAAGGIPEMVLHEKTGLLCPVKEPAMLAESVLRLLREEPLRGQLVRQAARHLQNFTKQATAEKTLAVYRELIPG